MKYLLDTSVISELISSQPNPNVVEFVDSLDQEDIYLSTITVGEVAKAIQKQPDPTRKQSLQKWLYQDLLVRFDGRIISLDSNIMIRWGELSAKVERIGVEFPAIDAMIAAIVLTHEMVLVTMYENDFKDTEIEVVNPW
jgi:toxin FitB